MDKVSLVEVVIVVLAVVEIVAAVVVVVVDFVFVFDVIVSSSISSIIFLLYYWKGSIVFGGFKCFRVNFGCIYSFRSFFLVSCVCAFFSSSLYWLLLVYICVCVCVVYVRACIGFRLPIFPCRFVHFKSFTQCTSWSRCGSLFLAVWQLNVYLLFR